MKKRMSLVAALVGIAAWFGFVGCNNIILQKNVENFGSLEITQNELEKVSNSRALHISSIKYARASVTGTGITNAITSDYVSVTNGQGTITVSDIPAGNNRIVTVQGYDENKQAISGAYVTNIVNIASGTNSCSVTQATTALGNVYTKLNSLGVTLSGVSASKISSYIDSEYSWALIDTDQIAADYKNSGFGSKTSADYILTTGTIKFTSSLTNSYTIQITDPSSDAFVMSSSITTKTVLDAAPTAVGKYWSVIALDSNKNVVGRNNRVRVKSGEETSITVTEVSNGSVKVEFTVTNPVTDEDCIIVHAKQPYIYVWETGTAIDTTTIAMEPEAGGWYVYRFENSIIAANMIFKDDTGWTNKTSDLSRSGYGEWWYKNGEWYDSNPDDSIAPELVSFTADKTGTVSGDVVLTVSATDNLALSKAVITIDETTVLTNLSLSGTSCTVTYTWETKYIPNGSHKVTCVVYDGGSRESESKSLIFVTNNANLPPVAMISGTKKPKPGVSVTYDGSKSYDQNGGTITYKWTVTGAVAQSSLTESKLKIQTPDSVGAGYTVSLVVTDNEGLASEAYICVCETVAVDPNWDFRDETIYFLMTTRFYDGDSSNNRYCWGDQQFLWSEDNEDPGWRGDFKGLIEKLDYIKALGFTAIWITPVVENASDLDYHGYHATDFSKVDPRYESTGVTYQTLIDACHDKGLKVIQDIVLNHCSNAGERNILPMTVKDYNGDVRVYNGVKYSVPMIPDHNATDIYGRNTYELLNQGVKALTGGKYNTYEELEADANGYYNDDTRGSLMYNARIYSMNNGLDVDNEEVGKLFHYCPNFDQWESYDVQVGTMAGDCVDLNTENPKVAEYLRNCYINYIKMGVDAFRIDTLKHISRLTMNNEFIPQFHEAAKNAGNDKFFMFGEACVKRCDIFNANLPGISVCFYTWNQNKTTLDSSYPWKGVSDYIAGAKDNLAQCKVHFNAQSVDNQLTSDNAFLNGVTYHAPDYSKYSGLSVIDFRMHHQFLNASQAYSSCTEEDQYFNDSTWNVTYVDSHDYGPNTILGVRYDQGTDAWAENLDLMFTFRGIPCIYYGSEIEFQAGEQIEPWYNGNRVPYNRSGRAYFGDHLEGSVSADGTGEYSASGAIKETLDSTLSQHIMRLNQIRAAVPALRKGQYKSYGDMKFVRRYTANGIDSVAVVSISGSASFSGLPAGTYIDVVSGDTQTIGEGGTITTKNSGKASMAVYVNATLDPSITGTIGNAGVYLK